MRWEKATQRDMEIIKNTEEKTQKKEIIHLWFELLIKHERWKILSNDYFAYVLQMNYNNTSCLNVTNNQFGKALKYKRNCSTFNIKKLIKDLYKIEELHSNTPNDISE